MKKIIAALSGVLLLVPFLNSLNAEAINFPMKKTLYSESAIVVNIDSDTIIHEKNADATQMPGPLVNIMTAIVCLENCENLNEEITIDSEVYDDLSAIQYPEDLRYADISNGDVLTVNDLLYAMMLTSSVEASQTLAYYVSDGDIDAFVDMMNDKAKEIGCNSTSFANPTGMYNMNQYTTARDMAVMTQYALTVPLFETIATAAEYNPSVPNLQNHPNHSEWIWTNSNLMMDEESEEYYYSGAKGIKTGNLSAAGRNVISLASRDGNNYLVVLLKAPIRDADGESQFYHLDDAKTVFDWAFEHFSYQVILSATAEKDEVSVTLAEGNNYVLARPKEEFSMLWYDEVDTSLVKSDGDNIKLDKESFQAPIKAGDRLGEVTLTYSGEVLGTVELVAVSDVERSVSKYNLYAAKKFPKSEWFNKAIIISSILSAIYVLLCIYSFICYKNNAKPAKSLYAIPKMGKKKKKKRKTNSEQ